MLNKINKSDGLEEQDALDRTELSENANEYQIQVPCNDNFVCRYLGKQTPEMQRFET